MKYMMYWPWNGFKGLACICKETWKSVGSPNASLYASSTGGYFGLLASPALCAIALTCAHVVGIKFAGTQDDASFSLFGRLQPESTRVEWRPFVIIATY